MLMIGLNRQIKKAGESSHRREQLQNLGARLIATVRRLDRASSRTLRMPSGAGPDNSSHIDGPIVELRNVCVSSA